ncbi:MAG: DUF2142 domain-containing protein [Candidatus Curtissbacteria bacterium]|nr:DUF2142 domain-containing protein [Candidatus Curtissbacteria bacterium]
MSRTIKLLFASALLNAICWIILIPVWQYPDEQAHFAQVQYIAEIGGIPLGSSSLDTTYEVAFSEKILNTERDDLGNNKFTYHPEYHIQYSNSEYGLNERELINLPHEKRQNLVKNEATLNPPLYYFLGSTIYNFFSESSFFTRVYIVRLMSAAIFLSTVFITYKLGQLIFKNSKILPIILTTLIAFKPMLVFSSTGVLPDTLTNFFFSLLIYICIKIILENLSFFKTISLLIVIILGANTRQHFLITLFILPFVMLEQLIFNKKSRKIILGSAFIFAFFLYVLSFFVGPLSFIRQLDYPESSQKINNPLVNLTYFEHLNWTIKHSIAEVWPWYWGIYKWLSLSLPPVVYQIINRLVPIALIGLLLKIIEIVKTRQYKKNLPVIFLILTSTIYFFALTTFDFFFRKNDGFSFGIQGRYFFPTILAHMAILLVGFNKIFEVFFKKYAKYALLALAIAMMSFNLFSLAFVSSTYYDFSNLNTLIAQISQYKPIIIKGNILYLIFGLALMSQVLFLYSFTRDILKLKS